MEEVMQTNSSQETQDFAKEFAKRLQPGAIVLLFGELGAGKTTFTQGLAHGFGITRRIISPTFIILRTYQMGDSQTFYHVDLYRLEKEKEIESIGLLEKMKEPHAITVIEWPEKLHRYVPKKRWEVYLTGVDNSRKITIKKYE